MRRSDLAHDDLYLPEGADEDVAAHDKASQAAIAISSYVHTKGTDKLLDIEGIGEFLAVLPKSVGLDRRLLILLGLHQKNTRGISGAYWNISKVLGKYDRVIVIYCLREITQAEARRAVNSTEFLDVVTHEFIHFLDDMRTNGNALSRREFDARDRAAYFNDPAEFNAFFHNFASNLLSFIGEAKKNPEDAADLADLYGISTDFTKTVRGMKTVDRYAFSKWLKEDRFKRAIARLYKLHKAAMDVIMAERPEVK